MSFTPSIFKDLNNKKNLATRSFVDKFETKVDSSGLSIKMPISGGEHYFIDKKEYIIKPREYLLVNKGQEIGCLLDSEQKIESVCIYLDADVYLDIFNSSYNSDPLDMHCSPGSPELISGRYYFDDCPLSESLGQLARIGNFDLLTEEDFILLTEKLVFQQFQENSMLNRINALNYATRMELMKRLRKAKAYIFENYGHSMNLDDIAKVSSLSKYHLVRLFKDVYSHTPYQALLKRRMAMAMELLKDGDMVQDVAIKCGFNDRRSFGRAFKNQNGKPPSFFNHP